MATNKIFRWRSAITGHFVTKQYAQNNPHTTFRFEVKPKQMKPTTKENPCAKSK